MTADETKALHVHADRVTSQLFKLDSLQNSMKAAHTVAGRLKGGKMVDALIQADGLRVIVRVNIGLVIAQLENDIRATTLWLRDNAKVSS